MDAAKVLLLVVDNPAHRVLFNRYLAATSHHLVYSDNGEDAYDRFTEVKPDLVLAHLSLGRLDGAMLCQLVRQRLGGTAVPVVLVGDEASRAEGQRRAQEVDADVFITLPIVEADFRSQLDPLLISGRSTTDVKARPPVEGLVDMDVSDHSSEMTDLALQTESAHEPDTTSEAMSAAAADALDDPPIESNSNDMDTVVSFKNPFFDAAAPPVEEVTITSAGTEEHITQVAIEAPDLDLPEVTNSAPAVIEVAPGPLGSAQLDRLEEPPINTSAGPNPAAKVVTKSRLIAEVPRERTPTGDSDERPPPLAGARRGLDESQLGKRLAKRVRGMHRMLDEASYYDLLGVAPGADYEQIRRAYYELSLEFHPDRFFLLRSGDLKEKIYAIYRKVAEAFQVLGDERSRRTYDQAIQRPPPSQPVPVQERAAPPAGLPVSGQTEAGQRYIDLAQSAYATGDLNHARLMLALAYTYEQDNPSLRAAMEVVIRETRPSL